MAAIVQGIGAATALSSPNSGKVFFSSNGSLLEKKRTFFVVRSEGKSSFGLNQHLSRGAKQLVTNAVATAADKGAASTASKPGWQCLSILLD